MNFTNSKLICCTILSPSNSGTRTHKIDTVTVHCMAGDLTVESCGYLFQQRQASSNYGIGSDGRIGLYVPESKVSWASSNAGNDNRAVTIEVANTSAYAPYPISQAAYRSLVNLLADICVRNGIPKLMWKANKSLIGQVNQQNITVHRWFDYKSCPGDYIYNRLGQIAAESNKKIEEMRDLTKSETIALFNQLYAQKEAERSKKAVSAWAQPAVDYCKQRGIMVGDKDGNFRPADPVSRQEMAQVLKNISA